MTEPTPRVKAVLATGAMQVEHCDIPEDMTLCEWRRLKAEAGRAPRRRGLIARMLKRAA